MITPLDIQNKEFAKGVRGYKEEDVDSFLDLLTMDMEKLLNENRSQAEQVKILKGELARYKDTESEVLRTLEAAKSLMGDISQSAEKRAQILVKNAELDAKLILREAREEAERLAEENTALRSRYLTFRARVKSLLQTELDRVETLDVGLSDERNMQELKEIVGNNEWEEHRTASLAATDGVAADDRKTMVNLRRPDEEK